MNRRYSIGGGGKSSYSKGFNDLDRCNFINFCRTIFKKTFAFTLAETLIVMGIIGVVAALTLPNLNSSTGDKEKVTKVKKIYSNLEDALGRAVAVYGPISEWIQNDTSDDAISKRVADRLTEFMKISKDCGKSAGCYPTKITGFDGNDNSSYKGIYNYILADGTGISIYAKASTTTYVDIYIDIDGPNKGQNRNGYDIFKFIIYGKDFLDCQADVIHPAEHCIYYEYSPDYYTAWVVTHGNLDYLKCKNQLDWDNKTSCK